MVGLGKCKVGGVGSGSNSSSLDSVFYSENHLGIPAADLTPLHIL